MFFAVMCLMLVPIALRDAAIPVSASESAGKSTTLYDPNPAHIWNRLNDALFIREDSTGAKYGEDSLDPLLFLQTEHLLAQPTHERAMRVLDEFLQTHAENQIHDPVKRALLQRDLWAVFDWSVRQVSFSQRPPYDAEKRELQSRLAEVLLRLALTPKEIESLPANYGEAVASGAFAKAYDPAHRDSAFLPPGLFDPRGPWVLISGGFYFVPQLVAMDHVSAFSGRERFLVYMRLPGGRKATFDYLQTLWSFPQPWVPTNFLDSPSRAEANPNLPSFPAGTEVALVRQMNLFDNRGNLLNAPITESVQMRVYRSIPASAQQLTEPRNRADVIARSGQDFYEIKLSRAQLFAGDAGGLRAVARDEIEFSSFRQHGDDLFEESVENHTPLGKQLPALQECVFCHSQPGINSLETRRRLLWPNEGQHDDPKHDYGPGPFWWDTDQTIDWKQDRYDWGLLNGYWRSAGSLR
ncbi:MAG: hypothetical protein WAM08_16675 [Candidatus Acidiferrales bacterium]